MELPGNSVGTTTAAMKNDITAFNEINTFESRKNLFKRWVEAISWYIVGKIL